MTITFTTNPLMVLQDTFPGITEDSEAFKVGSFCFEVIALYLVMTAAVVMTPVVASTLQAALSSFMADVSRVDMVPALRTALGAIPSASCCTILAATASFLVLVPLRGPKPCGVG